MAATHSSLSVLSTDRAPLPVGPYAQAVKIGNLIFTSGCMPIDPQTNHVVSGGIEAQTKRALANLKGLLEGVGSEVGKVAKTTIFVKSMDDFATINGICAEFFGAHKAARSLVEVARLPKDVLFVIEAIAAE
ncbi:YjgF-like protein [Rickenella mellea]|uniref:YjgF-like protein n=1 Tax=Rickenella mellea TaxID=50990 RepID=A0A4Y7PWK3_9AGAM|nr:YjgF-like protein [Rickenella mellea]